MYIAMDCVINDELSIEVRRLIRLMIDVVKGKVKVAVLLKNIKIW